MPQPETIGTPPWTNADAVAALDEFAALYKQRPIQDNQGGMRYQHMFATWFMVRKLQPDLIMESGIWKGQGTWLLEQAAPQAQIVSFDLNLALRQYTSDRVEYHEDDFSTADWAGRVTERSLAFFDDHQNAYERLIHCRWFGFRHVIFEDNYPVTQGDCYSLKKAFAGAGFEPAHSGDALAHDRRLHVRLGRRLARVLGLSPIHLTPQYSRVKIPPNTADAKLLREQLEIYHEFPPIVQKETTQWGDAWSDDVYPTPSPLLTEAPAGHDDLQREDRYYNWIAYTRLR